MTYEYTCEACGHSWEAEQSIKEAALKTCVSCGAPKAKRLVSGGTGFLLKGGGWYADGYGSAKGTSSENKSETSSTGESASSKPDTKAEPSKAEPSKEAASKPAEKAASDSTASKPTSTASTAS